MWTFNSVLWAIMTLSVLQPLHVAPVPVSNNSRWEQLNIEAMIDDFVKEVSGENTALWWDISAQQEVLKSDPHFQNRKVTVTTGPIVYRNATNVSMKAPDVYEHWVHNGRYNESHKSFIRKTVTQTQSYTWKTESTFTLSQTIKVAVGLPDTINLESTTSASISLHHGSGDTKTFLTEMTLMENVTVRPRTSLKLIWTSQNVAKDMPWTMNVTLHGWIAVWYYYKVEGHHLWFYPIDFLSGEGLRRIPGGGIQFEAKGIFHSVTSQLSSLRVEEHDLREYSLRPLSVTYRPVRKTIVSVREQQSNVSTLSGRQKQKRAT